MRAFVVAAVLLGHSLSQASAQSSASEPASESSTPSSTVSASSAPPAPSSTSTPKLSPEWAAAYAKAAPDVAKLSVQDKVDLATGVGWMNGPCVGNTPAIASIDFPGLCLQDSPLGIRFADLVSAFPASVQSLVFKKMVFADVLVFSAVNAAATFSRDLIRERGVAMGEEFKAKGVHVALGPMMNMARVAAGGRNWEGWGGDPYLSGEASYETILGIQSAGVQATAKHYIANEQEHFRTTSSSNIDDRTFHETYAYPFLRSVHANVASVMCSYNQVNGTYACEDEHSLNNVLKEEFGFAGYVMSDWQATHSTEPSVNGGLDMTMPGDKTFGSGDSWFGPALVDAVNSGRVSSERIDDLATRILAAYYLVGQEEGYPAVNFDSWDPSKGQHVNVQGNHKEIIRKIAAASTVLLKNEAGALPLKAPASLGIIGSGARNTTSGNPNQYADRGGNDGVLAMGWGSGTAEFPYLISPALALTGQATVDGTTLVTSFSDSDLGAAAQAARGKDAALVFITSDSGEGYITVEGNEGDRNDLKAWHGGDALVAAVAAANNNTIVVVNTVGAIVVEPWIEHENVTAVVWSGLPGQEAGNGLVDILYGKYNPSGRLPYTVAKAREDYSADVIYTGQEPVQIPYTEGIYIDYRHFDANNIEPRYEFGYGLSYTTFEYSGISVSGSPAGGASFKSSDEALFESVVTVSFTIANTGGAAGHEVPQVYVTLPDSANSAPLNLRGFDYVLIEAGSSAEVTIKLNNHDFSFWDTPSQSWAVPTGSATISVGASSRDIKLTGDVSY